MSLPIEIYPLATRDSQSIPLDIIRPEGVLVTGFAANADSPLDIPAGKEIGIFTTTGASCIVTFGSSVGAIVDNELKTNSVFIPEQSTMTVQLIGQSVSVRGLAEAGTLVLQLVTTYAALGAPQQFQKV